MLYKKGTIVFSIPLNEWVEKVLSIEGLHLIELSVPILIESCNLHSYEYKDPADRLIIAPARNNNSYLMTFDQQILDYGSKGYFKMLPLV